MTIKEKESILAVYSAINSTVNELNYYKREGYLSDTSALDSAENAKELLHKILFKTKKK